MVIFYGYVKLPEGTNTQYLTDSHGIWREVNDLYDLGVAQVVVKHRH